MVAEQITPGLWWDAAVATHCRLPKDGVVYHYHPVAFIAWFKNQLIDAAAQAAQERPEVQGVGHPRGPEVDHRRPRRRHRHLDAVDRRRHRGSVQQEPDPGADGAGLRRPGVRQVTRAAQARRRAAARRPVAPADPARVRRGARRRGRRARDPGPRRRGARRARRRQSAPQHVDRHHALDRSLLMDRSGGGFPAPSFAAKPRNSPLRASRRAALHLQALRWSAAPPRPQGSILGHGQVRRAVEVMLRA